MNGELTKLKMQSFKTESYQEKMDDFETLLNPESFTLKYKTEHNQEQAPGNSAASLRFNKILPQELKVRFVFDATGVVGPAKILPTPSTNSKGIIDDLEQFKKVVYQYNGEQHEPLFVKIFWGALLFKGKLSALDIEFKLFKPDGTPIRAVANATFIGSVEDDLRAAMENRNSPDLTHVRVVKEGDKLPLMTYKIYGDSKYYLEVARVNNILNFRKLKVGQKIFFPPLVK